MEIKLFPDLSEEEVQFIADSNYHYWKKISPTLDYQESTGNILAMKNNAKKLPIGIALVKDSQILGFCTLRENRLINHLDKNPWLCNVMIFEKFQGKGYARAMINFALEKFKTLGFSKVYVWTDQAPDFYQKLGWGYEGKITKNEGGEGLLFSKEI